MGAVSSYVELYRYPSETKAIDLSQNRLPKPVLYHPEASDHSIKNIDRFLSALVTKDQVTKPVDVFCLWISARQHAGTLERKELLHSGLKLDARGFARSAKSAGQKAPQYRRRHRFSVSLPA